MTHPAKRRDRRTIVLLGPQQGTPRVGAVLAELGIRGKIALVNAGYQENESDDAELVAAMGVPVENLRLHARAVKVFAEDKQLEDGYRARQLRMRHLQSFYRVRLDKTEDAAKTISVRYVDAELLEQEDKVSIDQFRQLDEDHVERCAAVRTTFDSKWRVAERPVVAKHREELKTIIDSCEALVIAGGHVASLYNRLRLFDVVALAGQKPVIAWSAGAMCLTDRIVLFHDYPPYGSDLAQVLESGFGLAPGLVVLPDPRRRIRLDEKASIAVFGRRMAPATCVAMDHQHYIYFEGGSITRASAIRMTPSGDVEHGWTGDVS